MEYGFQASIRKHIADKGITISRGHLSNVLAGRKGTRYELAKVMADLFGTSPGIWMGRDKAAIDAAVAQYSRAGRVSF